MAELVYNEQGRLLFTEEMRKEYTILIPNMLPIHFRLLERIFNNHGYKMKLLTSTGRKIVDEGMRYVHNDTCYPYDGPVRRRLPCLKLYPPYQKGSEKVRYGAGARYLP